MPKLSRIPSYRLHKPTGQARVIIDGKHVYLGNYGSPESRERYGRLIAERAVDSTMPAIGVANQSAETKPRLTIAELAIAYLKHAETYYRKDGLPTDHVYKIKAALRAVRKMYGSTLAADFGPLAFRAVQRSLVDAGRSRPYINDLSGSVKRLFKWAVSEEIVPVTTYQALATVPGLRKGRTKARETAPILPVDDSTVDATLPFLTPVVADMVRFQRLTGCRPGEVCIVRPCDVDTSGDVWTYQPASNKTEHHERGRTVFIGPKAQDILRPYLLRPSDAYCFSPIDSEKKRHAEMREQRKTRVQPSQENRRKARPKRQPREQYTNDSYRRAVTRGCEKANQAAHKAARDSGQGIEPGTVLATTWKPNQLRHARGTEVRRLFGLEAAQVTLGHARADVTQVYAERDLAKAAEIARAIG